jgi:type VI secretion system secreted protein Hcp
MRKRIGKRWRAALFAAVAAAGVGAALAAASVPGSDGVITACLQMTTYKGITGAVPVGSGPNLRLIDTTDSGRALANQQCDTTTGADGVPTEQTVTWNASGPAGPTGATGLQGDPGSRGVPGAIGEPGAGGKTVTVVGGGTVTLPNREVLTVGPAALASPPTPTNGRPIGFMSLSGLKQGSLKTKNSAIEILGFSFGSQTPTGSNSGGPTGKRQHSPITIVKEVDSASPLLLNSSFDGKVLKTVSLSFTHSSHGKETVYQRIVLTNATIAAVERFSPGTSSVSHHTAELESISFSFQKVEVTNLGPK